MTDLTTLYWTKANVGDAINHLARLAKLSPQQIELPLPPDKILCGDKEIIGRWIEIISAQLGLEAESVATPYAAVDQFLRCSGPALLRLPDATNDHFLAVLRGGHRVVTVLGNDLQIQRVRTQTVRNTLCCQIETSVLGEVDQILQAAHVPPQRRRRAQTAMLKERLSLAHIEVGWLLRLRPGAALRLEMNQNGLWQHLITFCIAQGLYVTLWLSSWWLIGAGALQGHLNWGWVWAWGILLMTLIPFKLLALNAQELFAVDLGVLLKRRLLCGALRLNPDEIRHQGSGHLLGQVVEAEVVETLALNGGFLGITGVIELLAASAILAKGAGGAFHTLLLIGWVILVFMVGWRYYQRRQHWTTARLAMTHDLVEGMVGHRTRLVQEALDHRHGSEDQMLAHYLTLSNALDRHTAILVAFLPRGWLLVTLLSLLPTLVSGRPTPIAMAVSLGGSLLAYRALRELVQSLSQVAAARIAWGQIAYLFHAANRPELCGDPLFALVGNEQTANPTSNSRLLQLQGVAYRYTQSEMVLQPCNLQVNRGDRLLLEGASGGGKSTLAALLTGLRQPLSGLILLRGLDQRTWGTENWRQRLATAPQFHENRVLTETFAFNLLMGRAWPPHNEDITAAYNLCQELGLGDLLARMPGGIWQIVGETGWQLSHGEQSRLFIARTLLQRAELVVLDESFGALDPDSLRRVLQCVLDRSPSLLVIAHP